MAKYLHLFTTLDEFTNDYYSNDKYYKPWVSVTKNVDNRVDYNKEENYDVVA